MSTEKRVSVRIKRFKDIRVVESLELVMEDAAAYTEWYQKNYTENDYPSYLKHLESLQGWVEVERTEKVTETITSLSTYRPPAPAVTLKSCVQEMQKLSAAALKEYDEMMNTGDRINAGIHLATQVESWFESIKGLPELEESDSCIK